MKKTLTILLSLMGVAVSEASIQELFTLTEASETGTPLYIPGEEAGTLDCSWTFVLTLDPAELAKITASSTHAPIFNLTFDTKEYKDSVSTGVVYYREDGRYPAEFLPISTIDDKGYGYISGATGGLGKGFSWDDVSNAALTLVVGSAKTKSTTIPVSIYQYITMNDGTVIKTDLGEGTDPNLYHSVPFGTLTQTSLGSVSITSDAVQSAACYYGVAEPEEVATLTMQAATGVVPEPTTATLSLLALAGLAARRRRK